MAFVLLGWHPSCQVGNRLWVEDAVQILDQEEGATAIIAQIRE